MQEIIRLEQSHASEFKLKKKIVHKLNYALLKMALFAT